MAISCNGKGCNGALDCDNCLQTNGCNVTVTCDICGGEIYEDYYEIDGDEICEDCLADNYKRSVDSLWLKGLPPLKAVNAHTPPEK